MQIKKNWKNSATVFVGFWFFVITLYLSGFSSRLYFVLLDFDIVFFVLLSFILGWSLSKFFWRTDRVICLKEVEVCSRQWYKLAFLWGGLVFISLCEFVYSRDIPLVSKLLGGGGSHFDFGIPSVHGLVVAGYLFFSILFSLFYIVTKDRKWLFYIAFVVMYSVLIMSRKLMMVALFQFAATVFITYRIKTSTIIRGLGFMLLVLLFFGFLGGVRTGHDVINDYGGFNSPVFEFLPGLGWGYLYLTTPLHNLVYASEYFSGEGSMFLSRTFEPLIPSVISDFFSLGGLDNSSRFESAGERRYWLESRAFNVSTAFIAPYIDNGVPGLTLYSAIVGFISGLCFGCLRGMVWFITNVIFIAGSALSIYSNNYSNLNFIGQFIWMGAMFFVLKLQMRTTFR